MNIFQLLHLNTDEEIVASLLVNLVKFIDIIEGPTTK